MSLCWLKNVKTVQNAAFSTNCGKISAQLHTTLCIQFMDRENNDKNNTLPLVKKDLFYNSMGLCGNFTPIAFYAVLLTIIAILKNEAKVCFILRNTTCTLNFLLKNFTAKLQELVHF